MLDRKENFSTTTTRHAMKMRVTLGASRDGVLKAIKIDNVSNTGAYGEEGPPVTMVVANNILPSYNRANAIGTVDAPSIQTGSRVPPCAAMGRPRAALP